MTPYSIRHFIAVAALPHAAAAPVVTGGLQSAAAAGGPWRKSIIEVALRVSLNLSTYVRSNGILYLLVCRAPWWLVWLSSHSLLCSKALYLYILGLLL